jgi:hypothetical protein
VVRSVRHALHRCTLWRSFRRTVPPEVRGTLVSLLLAGLVGGLALRTMEARGRDATLPAVFDQGAASPAPPAPYQARSVAAAVQPQAGSAAGASAGVDPAWEAARAGLGVPIVPPRALPAGMFALRAVWEPVDPAGLHAGMLRVWYGDASDDVVFELNIGVGVGVATGCAPPDAHGSAVLAGGTDVIWLRGYRWGGEDFDYRSERYHGGCTLTDQWLRLGVAPGAGLGWRLLSHRLALEDLLRVASTFLDDVMRVASALP